MSKKKRIKQLENDVIKLCRDDALQQRLIDEIYRSLKEVKCFSSDEAIPENTHLANCLNRIKAISNYLEIYITYKFEEDLSEEKLTKTKKVWKAYKKVKNAKRI